MKKFQIINACEIFSGSDELGKIVHEALTYIKKDSDEFVCVSSSGLTVSHFREISELRLKSCMERNFSVRGLRETTDSLILLPDNMIIRLAYLREDGAGPSFFFDPLDKIVGCIIPRNIDFRTKL